MPAAVIKGLIISISIITALGIAVLENPQVQIWLDEQRRKIAELLRSIGEELDPESRRQAEAFAYKNGTPTPADAGLQRGVTDNVESAAVATGSNIAVGTANVRRIPVRGPSDPDEAAERRRKGREYLARRNQQMMELQERRKAASAADGTTTPTSFDAIVDQEGKLRDVESETDQTVCALRVLEQMPADFQDQIQEEEPQPSQPLPAEGAISLSEGFRMGSIFANPFGDEYALERSETPRPPTVPPKIQLDHEVATAPTRSASESVDSAKRILTVNEVELTYEEQLAIALSLSEAESSANAATVRRRSAEQDDEDLKAAITASLREMDDQQAAHAVANVPPLTPRPLPTDLPPLVDLTPPSPHIVPEPTTRRTWEQLFDPQFSPSQEPLTLNEPAPSETTDELYRITPTLTRAKLASFDALQEQQLPSPSAPYDPVREAAVSHSLSPQPAVEGSFYSAPSSVSMQPSDRTSDREPPQLISTENAGQWDADRLPTDAALTSESDAETFASLSQPISAAASRTISELSDVEVVDLDQDSDVDMLSDAGHGISTPDSWTDVGSRDGESDAEDFDQHGHHRPGL